MDNETIELIRKYNKIQPSFGPDVPIPNIITQEEVIEEPPQQQEGYNEVFAKLAGESYNPINDRDDIGDYKSCNVSLFVSVSEAEICVNGVNTIKKTTINEDGEENISYYSTDGATIPEPSDFSIGTCKYGLIDYWTIEDVTGTLFILPALTT